MKNNTFKIRLFGIGLDTYWPQFPVLKERLEGYLKVVHQKLLVVCLPPGFIGLHLETIKILQ
jgi:L-arabinose isomerase